MKTLIALAGSTNAGKTTTIRFLTEILSKYPGCKAVNIFHHKREQCYLITINRKTIALLTAGDPSFVRELRRLLSGFAAKRVNIIVCACRVRGKTLDAVAAMEKKGYDIEWKFCPKLKVKNTDAFNKWRAEKLEIEIMRLVGSP
jgi:molybdopterin-guanine dinucleotide biosynthesis protein